MLIICRITGLSHARKMPTAMEDELGKKLRGLNVTTTNIVPYLETMVDIFSTTLCYT